VSFSGYWSRKSLKVGLICSLIEGYITPSRVGKKEAFFEYESKIHFSIVLEQIKSKASINIFESS
jgi:hypothetical protein